MKALILSFLLLCSCTKYSSLSKDAMGLRLSDISMGISRLDEIEWDVGKNKEATVTQSLVFIVDMPKVSTEDLEHLTELKGIDSWIVRLIVNRGSERQDLGSLYAYFKSHKAVRGQSGGAPTSVTLKVYYAAAYASERFRTFNCPAFSHSKRIREMRIVGENKPFDITIGQVTSYPEKSQLVELTPSSFNGGNSLAGEYYVEIAPYDSRKKVIHAPFKRLPQYVEVSSEITETIPSCAGVREDIK